MEEGVEASERILVCGSWGCRDVTGHGRERWRGQRRGESVQGVLRTSNSKKCVSATGVREAAIQVDFQEGVFGATIRRSGEEYSAPAASTSQSGCVGW